MAYETRLPSNTQSNRERIPVRSRIAGASRPAEPSPTEIPSRRSPSSRETAPGSTSASVIRPTYSLYQPAWQEAILTFCPTSKRPVRPPARSRIPSASKRLTPRSDSFCNSVNSNPSSAASLFPCEETTAGRIDDHAVQTEQTGFYHNFTKSIGYSIQSKTAYRRERSDKVRDRSIPFSKHRPKEGKIYEASAARFVRPTERTLPGNPIPSGADSPKTGPSASRSGKVSYQGRRSRHRDAVPRKNSQRLGGDPAVPDIPHASRPAESALVSRPAHRCTRPESPATDRPPA